MPAYCFYLIGPKRQIMAEPVVAQLENDGEAFVRATQMSSAQCGTEVWLEQRLVCHVPPKGSLSDHRTEAE
jgi:hypothetical protein